MRQELAGRTTELPPGTALKIARITAGVKLYVLAHRLGITESALSRMETGKKPIPDGFAERYRAALFEAVA